MIKAKCSATALQHARRSRRFIAIHRDEIIRLAAPLNHSPPIAPLRMSTTTLRPPHERSFQRISTLSFLPNRTAAVAHDGTFIDLSAQATARRCSTHAGEGVTVYVIDTGCRSSHEQLKGRVHTMVAPGSAYMSGEDDHGHGTHVAATIGGRDFGLAPRASLVCIKALSERNEGSAHDVVAGVQLAMHLHRARRGPGVISISLGGRAGRRKTALDAAADAAAGAGLSFVVAAGNAAADACAFTPGRARMAITVAAVDERGSVAPFSNAGGCVSVGAPGVRVWSAVADGDGAYGMSSGTSMAAPFVSGLVALLVGDSGRRRTATVRRWLRQIGLAGDDGVPVVSASHFCRWRRMQPRA